MPKVESIRPNVEPIKMEKVPTDKIKPIIYEAAVRCLIDHRMKIMDAPSALVAMLEVITAHSDYIARESGNEDIHSRSFIVDVLIGVLLERARLGVEFIDLSMGAPKA
jgi:hypothetical protein